MTEDELRQYTALNATTGIVAVALFQGLIDSLHAKGVMSKADLKLLASEALDVARHRLRASFADRGEDMVRALDRHAKQILDELFDPFDIADMPHE